jgi:hypothetical protein
MRHPSTLISLVLLIGCAPQHAEMSGTYTAWLAAGSSGTVDEGKLDLTEGTLFNCSGSDVKGFEGFDASQCSKDDDETWFDNEWFTWLDDDAYYVMKGTLDDAWRSEAIITSENDLQLTFHVALSGGQDFRAVWVIDPDFAPTRCTQDETGATVLELWDGADWVDKWSEDESGEDGSYIYYLNAGSYQLNPYDSEDYWVLPQEWLSGFGKAKFAAEEFNSRPTDFGMYEAGYTNGFYVELDPNDPDMDAYNALLADVQESAEIWTEELAGSDALGLGYGDDAYSMKVEDNSWRPVDQSSAGLDSWVQLESSWVTFDQDPDQIEAGDPTSGTFQILFKGAESGSWVLVNGTFDIPQVFEDRWGYTDLMEEKRLENETPECGG